MKPERPTLADLRWIAEAWPWRAFNNEGPWAVESWSQMIPDDEQQYCESATRVLNWLASPEGQAAVMQDTDEICQCNRPHQVWCAQRGDKLMGARRGRTRSREDSTRKLADGKPRGQGRSRSRAGNSSPAAPTSLCRCGHKRSEHSDENAVCWTVIREHSDEPYCPCDDFQPKRTSHTRKETKP